MKVTYDLQQGEHPKATIKMGGYSMKNGVGLDVGTMWLVGSRFGPGDKVEIRKIRDCYYEVEPEYKGILNLSKGAQYVNISDKLYLLGDFALTTCNMFGHEVRRPLSVGTIAAGHLESQKVLAKMILEIIEDFYKERSSPLVLIEGLELFIGECGFDATLEMLGSIKELTAKTKAILLIPISHGALDDQQQTRLEGEFEAFPKSNI